MSWEGREIDRGGRGVEEKERGKERGCEAREERVRKSGGTKSGQVRGTFRARAKEEGQ